MLSDMLVTNNTKLLSWYSSKRFRIHWFTNGLFVNRSNNFFFFFFWNISICSQMPQENILWTLMLPLIKYLKDCRVAALFHQFKYSDLLSTLNIVIFHYMVKSKRFRQPQIYLKSVNYLVLFKFSQRTFFQDSAF